MWRVILAAIQLIALLLAAVPCQAQTGQWERVDAGLAEDPAVAIALDPLDPSHAYVATNRAVHETTNAGATWRHRFTLPSGATLIDLAVASGAQSVLAATTHGVFGSLDAGETWSRPFKGDCTVAAFHPTEPASALLGTHGGLFLSRNGGHTWNGLTTPAEARDVIDLSFDPTDAAAIYVLASAGLFRGHLESGQWESLTAAMPPAEPQADPEGPEVEPVQPELRTIAVDPAIPLSLYLATSRGVRVSHDAGRSWQWLTSAGLLSGNVRHLLLQAHSPVVLYAATDHGIAWYGDTADRWHLMPGSPPTTRLRSLAGSAGRLWAATEKGLFRYDLPPEALNAAALPTPLELLANFTHEPSIGQVRTAAIRYAEVHPDKIARWRRQAAMKALLPTVNVGYDHDQSRNVSIDEGSFPNFQVLETEDQDSGMDVSVTWDLGDLIWNDDQTSIDVRSKLMVELRDDIVDEVTRLYFERRRLQVALLSKPPTDHSVLAEKELRVQELTALIDGLTGSYFSDVTKPNVNNEGRQHDAY